eukprot:TRINITY_DN1294_c0_g1_i1.p1 TRINITY_DN1294_c0_g1~~TRINITY_DN1294_c0_g1_i1.p1  ORF type:complete len:439 (+),score=91.66 TRINITY_DN1294_c0_g1_i1:101-1417(+)
MESPSSIPSYSPPSSTERKISPLPTFVLLSPSDLQSTEPSSQAVVSSSQTSNSPWTSPFPSPVPSPSSSPLNSPRDRSPISFVFPTSPLSQVGSDFPAYSAPASAFEQLPAKLKEQRFSSLDSILLSPKDIQLEPSNDTLREKQTYSSDALNYDSNIFHEREDLEHRTSFLELELKRALKVQADQMEEIDTLQHDKKNLVGQITQLKQETVLAISERDHFEHKMHGMESRMLKLQYEIDELKQEREKRVTSHSLIQRLRKGDNSWISECKTFAQKRELLEEALTSLDPEVILTVLLYLKESLSEKLFFQLLKRNSFLLDQYISFLRREGRFSSLAIIYDQLNQHWERDRCMLEKIFHCTSVGNSIFINFKSLTNYPTLVVVSARGGDPEMHEAFHSSNKQLSVLSKLAGVAYSSDTANKRDGNTESERKRNQGSKRVV